MGHNGACVKGKNASFDIFFYYCYFIRMSLEDAIVEGKGVVKVDADALGLPEMSDREVKFCVNMLQGMSGLEAFKQAFPERCSKMTDASIRSTAFRLMNREDIKKWRAALQLASIKSGAMTHAEYNHKLLELVEEARIGNKWAAVASLMSTLGKSMNYLGTNITVKNESIELDDQLKRLDSMAPEIAKLYREKFNKVDGVDAGSKQINLTRLDNQEQSD